MLNSGKKVYRVIITSNARDSLKDIVNHIKNKQKAPLIARMVKEELLNQILSLESFPEKFSKELFLEGLTGNYRSLVKWRYKIIYKVLADEVWVLKIIHTSQNPADIIRLMGVDL